MYNSRFHGGGAALAVVFAVQVSACGGDDTTTPPEADSGPDGSLAPIDGGGTPARDAGPTVDASSPSPDSGVADPGPGSADAGSDSGPDAAPDGSAPFLCSGGKPLAIFGNYLASDGTTQWLRQSATAATYSRIPAGAPSAKSPPSLWLITQVCSDQQVFVAQSETGTYARVDWAQAGTDVQVCIAIQGAADPATVLAAPASTPGSATGCHGAPWTTLTKTKTDGGL